MGTTVTTYFTPEERPDWRLAETNCAGMDAADLTQFAIPLAQSAALADQEARSRFEVLLQQLTIRILEPASAPSSTSHGAAAASPNSVLK